VVLSLDSVNRRLSLGIKQLEPDIWEEFFAVTQVGDVAHGKVVRLASFGAFVELREGIEGLCHISEIEDDTTRGGKPALEVGSERHFRVIRLNSAEKRIGLSLREPARPAAVVEERRPKAVEERKPKKEIESPSTMAVALSSAGVTLDEVPPAASSRSHTATTHPSSPCSASSTSPRWPSSTSWCRGSSPPASRPLDAPGSARHLGAAMR
jgi:small subunit ribosomal protein S1